MFSLLFLAKPTVLLQIDVFCGSRAEVVLRPIFVTWLCRACTRSRGLISLKFSRPGTVCTLFCGSRADVVLRQYLFPDSVARVRTRGLNFITPWSCLQFVGNCSFQSRSLFLAIFLTWVCWAFYSIILRGAGMAQWWEHSPSTNVARVRIPDSTSYVGWDCC